MGQLGNNTFDEKEYLVQITNETNWKYVACGLFHTVAIKEDGTLWAWGNNFYGQLGDLMFFIAWFPYRLVVLQIGKR